ncbi:MAG TPA: secretin, partial [Paraburkholderia sp.]
PHAATPAQGMHAQGGHAQGTPAQGTPALTSADDSAARAARVEAKAALIAAREAPSNDKPRASSAQAHN